MLHTGVNDVMLKLHIRAENTMPVRETTSTLNWKVIRDSETGRRSPLGKRYFHFLALKGLTE